MTKILIIDDDSAACGYLEEFFAMRKCTVQTAQSGKDGLKAVKSFRPDIVLLDYRMDDLNGIEVLKKIKEKKPDQSVIMITVASEPDVMEEAKKLGADDFIKKPFSMKYLEGTVSKKVSELARQK